MILFIRQTYFSIKRNETKNTRAEIDRVIRVDVTVRHSRFEENTVAVRCASNYALNIRNAHANTFLRLPLKRLCKIPRDCYLRS